MHKFDPIINKNCIEDHSKCFELFPNAYSFSLWNLESRNNYLKQTYKVYVINLDKSVERWKRISTDLDEVGIKYERFSAVNGNQVKLRNILTQEEFSGLDIKNKIAKIEKSVMYEVTCNSDDNNPTIFNYLGSFNHIKKGLSAGELGIWCSNIIIWKDIAKNNYKNAIILEDDVIIKKDIFKQGIHNFVTNVPKTFDIAYLDIHQYKGKQFPLVGNEYVNRFSDKSGGWGAWSILYNEKVINKLLALECYSYTVDDFFWSIITNKHYKKPECVDNSITLEVYTSSKDILDVSGNGSVICEMGRDFWQC